jgi:hypothetical protein
MTDNDYRRQNARKARETWQAIPFQQRQKRCRPAWLQQESCGDAVTYYHRHYAGLTRGELQGRAAWLYQYLRIHGLLDAVPLKRRVGFPDPLAYYREHYPGVTRWELAKRNSALYQRLRRNGLLASVPNKPAPFGADPLAYYREHYAGLTPRELYQRDRNLHRQLRLQNLLGQLPVRTRPPRFPDPLAYYQEHCAGMTRKQVSMAEPQFYGYLQRHRLLETIPFAPADTAGNRWPELLPDPPRQRPLAPAEQPRRRLPTLAAARLECFRVIPEPQ